MGEVTENMLTHDSFGNEYAKADEIEINDILRCDNAFYCLPEWTDHEVHKDENGLYINCEDGQHYLDGHYNEQETHYIGFYKNYK